MATRREKLEIRAIAQEYSPLAFKTLVNILRTGETDSVRLGAAKEILDRAYGKPVQAHKLEGLPDDDMTKEEALSRAERFTSAIAGLVARAPKG